MSIPYIKSKSFFTFITKIDQSKKNIILELIDTYSYLLNSINKLLDNFIVHFDLKAENILYNIYTGNPIIIDFGISIPIKDVNETNIKNYFYIYAPEYFIWPLEVHIICYILHHSVTELTIENIREISYQYISQNKALHSFSDDFREKYHESCIKYFSKYIKMKPELIIKELKSFYTTWDNYALSILYLFIFSLIFENNYIENDLFVNFSQLLVENIHPNPERRHSILETQEKFQDFFFIDKSKNNYLNFINNLNFNIKTVSQKNKCRFYSTS